MDKDHEGFCEKCARKERVPTDEPARLCGHASHLSETSLCVTCAVRLGLCRGCGMSLSLQQKTP